MIMSNSAVLLYCFTTFTQITTMLVVEAVSRACKSQILSNVKGADGGGGGGGPGGLDPHPLLTRPSFENFSTVHFLSGFPSLYKC